jgi:hypothetical protein
LFVGDGPRYRSMNITLKWLSDADRIQAKELARAAGRRSQVLVIPNETGDIAREAMIGHFDKLQPVSQALNASPAVHSQNISIIQDL